MFWAAHMEGIAHKEAIFLKSTTRLKIIRTLLAIGLIIRWLDVYRLIQLINFTVQIV
jgi:hypothetical protein